MRTLTPVSAALIGGVLGLAGCSSPAPKADSTTTTPSSSAAASAPRPTVSEAPLAAPPASSSAAAELPPVCKVSNQKVWGAGANKLTGLTTRNVGDNQVAVGFALGVTPHVLVVNKGGGGQMIKVDVKAGSPLASPPKAGEGIRHLMRVTPSSYDKDKNKATAMVDFRDEYKDKKRLVACGASDADPFLSFEGTSYLDLKEKPSEEEKKKLFTSRTKGVEGYVELRDCRSFFSRKSKETWVVGSLLRGVDKTDRVEWSASLVIDFGPKDKENVLHEVKLKDDPPKSGFQFEVPTSIRIKDKGYVLATRFGGSMLIGALDLEKKGTGKMTSYPGLPMLTDLSRDDTHVFATTAVATAPGRFGLRSLIIPADTLEMPKAYTPVKVDEHDKDGSQSSPELVIDKKKQMWLAYVEGERDKGHLEIMPVNAEMKRVGRPHVVTEDKERASEARVVPMDDGDLLVVYLRDTEGKVELVSEELTCSVKN